MPRLPQFLSEVPEYNWNQRDEVFDVRLFKTNPDGTRTYTDGYTIRPEVYRKIITEMIAAQQDYYKWRENPDNVVRLRPGQH